MEVFNWWVCVVSLDFLCWVWIGWLVSVVGLGLYSFIFFGLSYVDKVVCSGCSVVSLVCVKFVYLFFYWGYLNVLIESLVLFSFLVLNWIFGRRNEKG